MRANLKSKYHQILDPSTNRNFYIILIYITANIFSYVGRLQRKNILLWQILNLLLHTKDIIVKKTISDLGITTTNNIILSSALEPLSHGHIFYFFNNRYKNLFWTIIKIWVVWNGTGIFRKTLSTEYWPLIKTLYTNN